MLPITQNGQPDYFFMENYIKNIDYKKRKKYLDYVGGYSVSIPNGHNSAG